MVVDTEEPCSSQQQQQQQQLLFRNEEPVCQQSNAFDHNGNDRLMWAVAQRNENLVFNILRSGSFSPLHKNALGETALHVAAREGDARIALVLLKCNFDPNCRTFRDGLSPLHVAAQNGHKTVVRLLQMHGASLDLPDVCGDRALHWAIRGEHFDCAVLLVELGANPNALNEDDESPLYFSVLFGSLPLCRFLLANGASLDSDLLDTIKSSSRPDLLPLILDLHHITSL
eukprot:TRINITY_DN674_c0_g1_i1.p1 TRINITY_DN674_c0_g1~~TRINITY_DN674_c0_g1_i1.p1  ORF type:complete len:229 (+),score=113.91 TRINITY_DN674_c0_g1_i1:700-1386(+)